tara:strand:+ start:263 stop:577 length:315 start_codon:yes stop_codon:yes gene_type:complete
MTNMRYLYFKEDGTLWVRTKSPDVELEKAYPNPIVVSLDFDIRVGDGDDVREKTREEIENGLTYSMKRMTEYPSIQDQLDYIYHNGLTKWKSDMIKPVKDKHPK